MSRSILAAAGILFMLLLIAAIAYLIFRLIKSDAKNNVQITPDPTPEDPLAEARGRYDSALAALGIPNNAMTVHLVSNNYAAQGSELRHYCWIRDGVLMLFPVWDSIVGISDTLAVSDIRPRDWRIQLSDIVCYATQQGLPDKFVILQFGRGSKVLTLAFAEDAAKVFELLMPEKDLSNQLEELYPRSSRNIRDIKEGFVSLRELFEGELITEDEYNAKKKEMLILM